MSSRTWLLIGAITFLVSAAVLVACQPARVLNGLTPRGEFTLNGDLDYGDHPRQRLDIYLPRKAPEKQVVLVFVYGGSWEAGSKEQFLFVGEAFARQGYVTVIPNYRLYPEVEFPAFVDDVALAIARLEDLLPSGCPGGRELVLMGHSAGGHTAAMLATEPKYLLRNGAGNIRIAGFVGLAAPYDLPLDHELVVDKFTRVQDDIEANPIRLATVEMPPSLLLHGAADTTAYPYHLERFGRRLRELGVPVTEQIYPGVRHLTLLGGVATVLQFSSPAFEDVETFLAQQELDRDCG